MCKGVQWCMAVMHGSVRSVIIMIIIITVIIKIIIITVIIITVIIITVIIITVGGVHLFKSRYGL